MKEKRCPFAILARGHMRLEESMCLEDDCAIWTGDECAILALAAVKVAPSVKDHKKAK
jgi:hypothetical protein